MESNKSLAKTLYRSEKGKVIGGVCSGLSEHYNTDPIFIRLIFILLSLVNGLGIIIYGVLWLILPRGIKVAAEEAEVWKEVEKSTDSGDIQEDLEEKHEEAKEETIIMGKPSPFLVYLVLGLLPVIVGAVFLLEKLAIFPGIWFLGRLMWPAILVIVGFIIIVAGAIRK